MKLRTAYFILLLLPGFVSARAQATAPVENKSVVRKVDSFVKSFVSIAAMVSKQHPQVDETTVKIFTDLFTGPSASVEDYANYNKLVKGRGDSLKPVTLMESVATYAVNIKDSFPGGLRIKRLFNANIDIGNNGLEVKAILCRRVRATTAGKQEVEFTDTLELSLVAPDSNYHYLVSKMRIINGTQMAGYGAIKIKKASFYLSSRNTEDNPMSQKFLVSLGINGGTFSESYKNVDISANYLNALNSDIGKTHFRAGSSLGFDLELEYYIGESTRIGIGTGLSYAYQQGQVTIDKFHIEYESTDGNSKVFRQIITAKGPIKEKVSMNNMNIPLLLKYKVPLSEKLGLMMDAGVLFNVFAQASSNVDASFDYEAAYQFIPHGTNYVAVYDNQQTLNANDWLITRQQFDDHNTSEQTASQYFDQLTAEGYNVGLDKKSNNSSSAIKYAAGSVGFLFQPSVSYKLSERVYLVFGLYYSIQNFSIVSSDKNYLLTDKVGEYSSIVNAASKSLNSSFGLHVGLKVW